MADRNSRCWHTIDWGRPWLAPYRSCGEAATEALLQGASVAEALNPLRPQGCRLDAGPLRFVAADAAGPVEPYESYIFRTACVPTRDILHDLFNGLAWLVFPTLKRALNEGQARHIAQAGVGPHRGTVRDRLTLCDENGAFWTAPEALRHALRERDWDGLFWRQRSAWAASAVPVLFGHALLEKLVAPRPAITAHVWVGVDPRLPDAAERVMGERPHPLPVLGIPGWWPDNEDRDFYADRQVFRPHPLPDGQGNASPSR